MRLVSFNVNGLRAILKKDFENDFYKLDADIFSLNETKLSEKDFSTKLPFEPAGYFRYFTNATVRNGYSGVAVYTKVEPINVHYGLIDNKYDDEGRVITLEFDNFYYVASYVPNSGEELKRLDFRMQYEEDLKKYFKTLNKPIIYAGDLNVCHNEIDLKNPKGNEKNAGFTKEERQKLSLLLEEGYVDTFRYLYPDEVKYSWWSYRANSRERNIGWRIDYFIVSRSIKDKIIDSKIHNDIMGSDHCPVELEIDL